MANTQKSKPRLGRGLSSLISVSELPVIEEISEAGDRVSVNVAPPQRAETGQPLAIPVGKIRPNPHQPRKAFSEASVAELAASFKSAGIIQPLIVRRKGDGYELIAGERRLRAAQLAGLAEVPAVIRDVDGPTQAQLALIENIQREDLNPIDRAQGYKGLMAQLGLTQAELAARMGEERSSVANYLRLLELCESVQGMVCDGRLTLGHAKVLAGIPDILEQQRLAEIVLAQSLSVRNLERLLQNRTQPEATRAPSTSTAHLQDLEKNITRQLGMRTQVRSTSKGKGRLIVHYASLDQFDELLQKLGVSVD